jgi:hypothetical protein
VREVPGVERDAAPAEPRAKAGLEGAAHADE